MSLLDKLRTRKRAKTDGAFETYRKLIVLAAKAGALSDRDEAKLEEAADALGFSLERIEADIAVLADVERLRPLADGVEQAKAAADTAKHELRQKQIDAELAAKSAAAAASQAEGNRNALLQRWRSCTDAHEKLQALQRQHYRLLGIAAPTVDPAQSPADGEPIDAGYNDAMFVTPDGDREMSRIQPSINQEFHPAASIFPLDEEHIEELAEDIRLHGQQVEIERLNGLIIDGRRRFWACKRADIAPKFREIETADPFAYVVSLNLHRRHLTPGQRAMSAAMAREGYERMAKERQAAALARGNKTRAGKESPIPANLPESAKSDARDQVGQAFGIDRAPLGNPSEARQAQIAERTEIELSAQRDRAAQRQALQAEMPAAHRTISNSDESVIDA